MVLIWHHLISVETAGFNALLQCMSSNLLCSGVSSSLVRENKLIMVQKWGMGSEEESDSGGECFCKIITKGALVILMFWQLARTSNLPWMGTLKFNLKKVAVVGEPFGEEGGSLRRRTRPYITLIFVNPAVGFSTPGGKC